MTASISSAYELDKKTSVIAIIYQFKLSISRNTIKGQYFLYNLCINFVLFCDPYGLFLCVSIYLVVLYQLNHSAIRSYPLAFLHAVRAIHLLRDGKSLRALHAVLGVG